MTSMEILIIQFVMSMAGTIGFAVLFYAPVRDIIWCGLVGASGWIIYFLLETHGSNMIVATTAGAIVLTIFARILATIRKKPVTVYLVTGIFPLVPGSGIYYTALYVVKQSQWLALDKLGQTVGIAAAISFGILLAFIVPQSWLNHLHRQH